GYGGAIGGEKLLFEGSTAIFLSREIAIVVEYRQKANNLAIGEQDWQDLFDARMPNNFDTVPAAYIDLGSFEGAAAQTGSV
ncbi:DUF3034 domain-containing protein, partial [Pseudoalteromonas sp. S1727]|uniref:DUF3034 family protein n=1 Tax=Pseudoalteromonas sp. S1727 TaxID=2066514 RepID=UPI00110827D8